MNPRHVGTRRTFVCDQCDITLTANPVTSMELDELFIYCSDPCKVRHQSRHHADHLAQRRIDFTAGFNGA